MEYVYMSSSSNFRPVERVNHNNYSWVPLSKHCFIILAHHPYEDFSIPLIDKKS